MDKKIFKIVLTGGPCAGKTKVFKAITDYLKENDFYVITVGETATELIKNKIIPSDNKNHIMLFQDLVLKNQYIKENIAETYAKNIDNKKPTIILYDRGIMDNRAYLETDEEFEMILENNNLNGFDLLNNYDLVIDLVSTASLMPEEYKLDEVRFESVEEARYLDYKTTMAWLGHPNMKIVRPTEDIKTKTNEVINIITNYIKGYKYQKKHISALDSNSDLSVYNESNSKILTISNVYLKGDLIVQKRRYKNTDVYMLVYPNSDHFNLIDKDEASNLVYNRSILFNETQKEIFFTKEGKIYKIISEGDKLYLEYDSDDEIVISENLISSDPVFIKKRKCDNI